MKKLLFVLLAAAMLFGCQKKDVDNTPALQDVSFNATEIIPEINREGWECKEDAPTHAWVEIDDVDYYLELFVVDGILFTQSIKLPVGDNYCIQNFILFKDMNANGTYEEADDITTHGTPYELTDFADYVSDPLPICFDVLAFEKAALSIDVLCFEDVYYLEFGFEWFVISEIELSGFCFFGDICLNGAPYTVTDFAGEEYGTSIGADIHAIMEIRVFMDGEAIPAPNTFNNASDPTEPLCAYYYDSETDGEVFTFELWILVPDCNGDFDYEYFDTFTSTDDGPLNIDVGDDNILDYVVGNCSYGGSDITYGHYQWLVTSDFYDATNPDGFLLTDDATTGVIWRWQRYDAVAAANITDPMSYYLYLSGYNAPALLGFDAIWNDLNNGNRFWSTSPSGLMGGWNATGIQKYMDMTESIFPAWSDKYRFGGLGAPREAYWGYDCLNMLRSLKMAADNGVTDASSMLATATTEYLSIYVAKAAASDYDRIFINVLAAELGIGTFQGTVVWDENEYGLQTAAYGLMGGSWDNPYAVKEFAKANVCSDDTSESVVEAIYALGL